jgi:lipopolysaccharide export system protein LptA
MIMKKIDFKIFTVLFALVLTTGIACAITIESKKQDIHYDENKGYFDGDVKVQVGDVVVTSPRAELDLEPETKKASLATFFDKPYALQVKNNKKHEVKADIIKVSLIKKVVTAQGNAQTNVLEDTKPTVIITADTQEYDTNTNLMSAFGSVVINYEDVVATSDNAYALMDKNGEIQNLKLVSRATVKQDKSIIKGDSLQYSKAREDITVSGNTISDVTFENGDRVIINARSQQYNRLGNTIMASGNVHVRYADYTADGPKAIMHIDPKTNKPQKIIFLGRSKIVEKGVNSVEADKITMLMNPKKFEAVGKVKTNIEQTGDKNNKNEMEFSL